MLPKTFNATCMAVSPASNMVVVAVEETNAAGPGFENLSTADDAIAVVDDGTGEDFVSNSSNSEHSGSCK